MGPIRWVGVAGNCIVCSRGLQTKPYFVLLAGVLGFAAGHSEWRGERQTARERPYPAPPLFIAPVHSFHESHNLVAAFCQFGSTSGITVTPTAGALHKDISFRCRNGSGEVAKRKLVCCSTPFDFIGVDANVVRGASCSNSTQLNSVRSASFR